MTTSALTDDIERVLYLGKVHCYAIPPLQANKGHKAADWNITDPTSVIFTARVRVIETSSQDGSVVKTNIKLEDPSTGELFANGPYEGAYCVTPVLDSSRFFALRVVDGARRAYLGIGFEERSEAFDFGVCLQEIRRQNNLDGEGVQQQVAAKKKAEDAQKKDYSLKEGETISITIGNKGRRRQQGDATTNTANNDNSNSPAPLPFLPPPPSAEDVKKKRQSMNDPASSGVTTSTNPNDGFDDDPFGDFQ